MTRFARLVAAIVPVVGLAAMWGLSSRTYHTGTDWEVPVEGYDPRDYLRGHYVEFTYDWPGVARDAGFSAQALCLKGSAPRLERAVLLDAGEGCAHPVRADRGGVYGWGALMTGRLYIGQDRAARLEQQLRNRDQRGIVTIRQREDGSFTPIGIRFRPLTPAEIEERDAQRQEAGDLRPPPPIMSQ